MKIDSRHLRIFLLSSVAFVALVVYLNSLANGFAYDDDFIILYRDNIHQLGDLTRLLSLEYWPKDFDSGLYRPLTILAFAVEWRIWDGSPLGFHIINILLHAGISSLVTLFLLIYLPWWAAWAAGIVFAVHSVHTEAVANVVGQAELLAALFVMLACIIYARAVRGDRVSVPTALLIGACYALAGVSKETGFVLPGLLLATDIPLLAKVRRAELRSFVRLRLPLFALLSAVLIALLGARFGVLGAALESVPDRAFVFDDSFPTRLFTMARVWPRYFELLVFPLSLSADYSPAVILPADRLTLGGSVGFLLVLTTLALALATIRRAPELAMAVSWAGVALLPVSNLILTTEIVLAERTLYLPSVAVAIVVGLALARVKPPRRAWVATLLAAWVLFFSVVTIKRNPVWASTNTVFEDLRRKHPESSRVLWGVGSQYYRDGDWPEAKKWFLRSLEVWPYHAQYQAEFALALSRAGELEEAGRRAEMAVELNPDAADYHKLLALIRVRMGDGVAALGSLDRALEISGPHRDLYILRADAHALLGQFQEAARAQREAINLGAPVWGGWLRLARLRVAAGDSAAALVALDSARQGHGADLSLADSLEGAWSP
ncbi:MAG: tetratricopeptide repeat protein [Gemmatimonadota bacterium]